jgi:hypothetical protein
MTEFKDGDPSIEGPNHALLCGEVWGSLMRAEIDAMPITSGGSYTNQIVVTKPSGTYLVEITPMDVKEGHE